MFDCYSHVSIFDNWTKTNDKNIYFKIEKKNRGAIKHIYIYSKYRHKALEKILIFRINKINTSFIDINFALKSLPTMENNRPIQKYYDIVLKDIQKSKKIYNLTKKKPLKDLEKKYMIPGVLGGFNLSETRITCHFLIFWLD